MAHASCMRFDSAHAGSMRLDSKLAGSKWHASRMSEARVPFSIACADKAMEPGCRGHSAKRNQGRGGGSGRFLFVLGSFAGPLVCVPCWRVVLKFVAQHVELIGSGRVPRAWVGSLFARWLLKGRATHVTGRLLMSALDRCTDVVGTAGFGGGWFVLVLCSIAGLFVLVD